MIKGSLRKLGMFCVVAAVVAVGTVDFAPKAHAYSQPACSDLGECVRTDVFLSKRFSHNESLLADDSTAGFSACATSTLVGVKEITDLKRPLSLQK
jgi:hypothetical protein